MPNFDFGIEEITCFRLWGAFTYDIQSLGWWVGLKIWTSPIKNELYTKKKSDMGGWVGQKWPKKSDIICGWPHISPSRRATKTYCTSK